jgi:hypothetical protein
MAVPGIVDAISPGTKVIYLIITGLRASITNHYIPEIESSCGLPAMPETEDKGWAK